MAALLILLAAAPSAGLPDRGAPPGAAPGATAARDGGLLRIEAPATLAGEAARIAAVPEERLLGVARLVGLDGFGPPIVVVLAPEESAEAAGKPEWVAGYAYGALGRVVLLPERSPSYPVSSLEELLRHEVAHVLLARATAGRPVPRWFNEGVATLAGSSVWDLEDRSRLTLAVLFEKPTSLERLDRRFAGGRGEVRQAYALSGALVRDLFRRFGRSVAGDVLGRVAVGVPFPEAFRRTTGISPQTFLEQFWERHSLWYRWLPLATSSTTLWLGIVVLALWAARRRRRRRALLEEAWELEEKVERELARPPDA